MSFIELFLRTIAPFDCLVCGAEGSLVCSACRPAFGVRCPSRCFRCLKQTVDFRVCASCRPTVGLNRVYTVYPYDGFAKLLVKEFKFNGKRSAAHDIAAFMCQVTPQLPSSTIVVYVPTAAARVRARGYDHAKLLASAYASQVGAANLPALRRINQHRQLGATRAERFVHMKDAYSAVNNKSIQGADILLVDDVITTGATLSSAARILRAAGASHVSAIVFAQTIL